MAKNLRVGGNLSNEKSDSDNFVEKFKAVDKIGGPDPY
jgi:hypothetical protein